MSKRRIVEKLAILAVSIVTWEIVAARVGNPMVAPSIRDLATEAFPSFSVFGEQPDPTYPHAARVILQHVIYTSQRWAVGLFAGTVVGISIGLAIFSMSGQQFAARSLLAAARSVPLFSLIPLFVFWWSSHGEFGINLYVTVAVVVIVSAAVYEATLNVPKVFVWRAGLAGAGIVGILRAVILPAIWPELKLTLRWVVGLNWAFTLGGEYVSSHSRGLGYLAYQSYLYADIGKLIILAGVYLMIGTTSIVLFDAITGIVWRSNAAIRSY